MKHVVDQNYGTWFHILVQTEVLLSCVWLLLLFRGLFVNTVATVTANLQLFFCGKFHKHSQTLTCCQGLYKVKLQRDKKKKAPSHTHKHVFADWRSVLRSHNRFFKRKWQKINLPNTEHLKYSNVLQNQPFNVSSTGNRFEVCQKQREFWNIHTSHAKTKEGSSISHYEHFKVPYYSSYIRNIWPLKDLSP